MTSVEGGSVVDELIPVLIQCFGVIVLGYLTGRWKMLSDSQALGLNAYVTKLALPVVFFKVMVSIDFTGVCWYLVAAVSVSKMIAFVLAFVVTLLLSRSSQLGLAAILAMFVSQSNDVALAFPVLKSLYPDLANYIYLFAPTQLVVLNPFAYFVLEWYRARQLDREAIQQSTEALTLDKSHELNTKPNGRCRRISQVLCRVLLNPIFFMTVIGVIFNFILKHNIPYYVDGLLKIIADSFAATALFTLGFGMVGKMSSITQHEMYILAAILFSKLILLPFITREMVVQILPSQHVNETIKYSTFGFLYGVIPTAPPVYLFAAEYRVLPAVIGVGLVLGTFLCAPMMFILSRMVTIYLAEPSEYDQLLGNTVAGVSWISIAGCIWTFIVLFISHKAFRIPHRFVVCHLVCVLLSCGGVVAGTLLTNVEPHEVSEDSVRTMPAAWAHYVQFTVFFVGCTGARFWTTLLALSLFFQRVRGVCFVLRHQYWFYLIGFITPTLITSLLLITSPHERVKDVDPAFQYGVNQLLVSLTVLIVNTIATISFLIGYVRMGSNPDEREESDTFTPTDHQKPLSAINRENRISSTPQGRPSESVSYPSDATSSLGLHNNSEPPGILLADSRQSLISALSPYCQCTSPTQRRRCSRILVRYNHLCAYPFGNAHQTSILSSMAAHIQQPFRTENDGDPGIANCLKDELEFHHQRHMVFILVLLTTMFFGMCLCTWRLVQEPASGVYLVLEFLDGVFNFGQGILLFMIFGLDADLIILPIRRFFGRQLRRFCGVLLDAVPIDNMMQAQGTKELEQRCHQFVTFHLISCSKSLAKSLSPTDSNEKVFTEDALKGWLQASGLAHSNHEAALFVEMLESKSIVAVVTSDHISTTSYEPSPGQTMPRLLRFTQSAYAVHSTEQEQLHF